MKTLVIGLGLLCGTAAYGQALPEPLSFTGVPAQDGTALVDLSARFGLFDEGNVESNFNTFLFEGRFQLSPQFSFYGLLPITDLSSETNIGGIIFEVDDTTVSNPELGGLFSLPVAGAGMASFGIGVTIPVVEFDDAAPISGLATNDINAVLYLADTLALRPHFRFGGGTGNFSAQALLGLDIGIGVDNNNDDVIALRGGISAAFAVVPQFALMGEVTFASNLDDNNDFDFATLHLGGRGLLASSGASAIQPAFEFFLPIAEDFDNLIELGFAIGIRAIL
jgi:hypothetical protein